jgi:peroxiredoxin
VSRFFRFVGELVGVPIATSVKPKAGRGSIGNVMSDEPEEKAAEGQPAEAEAPEMTAAPAGPSRARRIRRYVLEGALVVGVFLTVSHLQTRKLIPDDTKAPDLTLRDLDGRTVTLADLHGKRVLLHFWATWCGVCQHEVGALNATQAALAPDEVLLTVVADGDNRAAVEKFANERGVRYPILLGNEDIVRRFHVNVFPTSYYLSPDGRIDDATVGMSTRYAMQTRLGCAK